MVQSARLNQRRLMEAAVNTGSLNRIEFVWPIIHRTFKRSWAENFLHKGELWFTNLRKIREDDDPQRGDCLEGTGKFIRNGQKCTLHSYDPIFVCCFTMETNCTVIMRTWAKDRDTTVQIYNPLSFVKRIRDAATKDFEKKVINFLVGPVIYDKDEGSHREHFLGVGAFQKNLSYDHQKEFRFAFLMDFCLRNEANLILKLGDCTDIARLL